MKKGLLWCNCLMMLNLITTQSWAIDLHTMTKEKFENFYKIKGQSDKPLIAAAQKGDVIAVNKLLEEGADVNIKDAAENTSLIVAVEGDYTEVVKILLDAGAEVNVSEVSPSYSISGGVESFNIDSEHEPLFLAVSNDNVEIVKMLLDKGANVNKENKYYDRTETAIEKAMQNKSLEIAKLLMEYGAKLDNCDELIGYILQGADEVIEQSSDRMFWKFRDVDNIDNRMRKGEAVTEAEKKLLYEFYAWMQNKEQIKKEMAAQKKKEIENLLMLMKEKCAEVNGGAGIDNGRSGALLLNATYYADVEAVRLLLKNGVDVNVRDAEGETPLIKVMEYPYNEENQKIAQMLIENGADVNAQDNEGETALMRAVWKNQSYSMKGMLEILINAGADVNIKGGFREHTALFGAISHDHIYGGSEETDFLLEHGANINVGDKQGFTPLMEMVLDQDLRMVKKLLEKGANVNSSTIDYGETVLMKAAFHDNPEIIQILLDKGADVNATDKKGKTALSIAREEGNEDVEELLIKYGAK